MTYKDILDKNFERVFEMSVLVLVLVFGAAMLAAFPGNDNLADWIKGGAIIAVLARAFGSRGGNSGLPTPPIADKPKE